MWRQVIVTAFVLLTCDPAGTTRLSPQQGKPTELNYTYTTFKEPPSSLREMALEADAVVIGRILGGVSKDVGYHRKTDPGVTTTYRFQVREVLHAFGSRTVDPKELAVIRDGGTVDRGAKVVKEEVDGFPQFELGHEYVLFLRWSTEHDAWAIAWGPNGAFEIIAGKVRSNGYAAAAKEENGQSAEQFLGKLRRLFT